MAGWIENKIEIISLVVLISFITTIECISLVYWIGVCIEIIVLLLYVDNCFMIVIVLRLCTCTVIL